MTAPLPTLESPEPLAVQPLGAVPRSASSEKFDVIYADPPWSYYNDMTITPRENKTGGGSMKHPQYPVMSSMDIKRLPIESIAADNSILFIWTTDYHMEKAMGVIRAWGFEYKTVGFAWQKTNKSGDPVCFMGAYTMKTGIELCLLATRGKNARKMVRRFNVRGRIESPRGQHSQKPNEARKRIVELVGDRPRVELFAREKHEGWSAWGNEVASDISLPNRE